MAISKKTRFEVFKRDRFTCQYCGAKAPHVVLECDHVNPVSNFGTDHISNLITSCKDCNSGKSSTVFKHSRMPIIHPDDSVSGYAKGVAVVDLYRRTKPFQVPLKFEESHGFFDAVGLPRFMRNGDIFHATEQILFGNDWDIIVDEYVYAFVKYLKSCHDSGSDYDHHTRICERFNITYCKDIDCINESIFEKRTSYGFKTIGNRLVVELPTNWGRA